MTPRKKYVYHSIRRLDKDWTAVLLMSSLCHYAGPWAIAHSPPNSLPTKTNYRQMLDNVLQILSSQAIS